MPSVHRPWARNVHIVATVCGAVLASISCGGDEPTTHTPRASRTAVCGNHEVEIGELCDGTALGQTTCTSLGYASGNLGCKGGCLRYDLSHCTAPLTCGNGVIDVLESCDAQNLAEATCASLGYQSGTLRCTANCAEYDTSACGPPLTCGNGTRESLEACDGPDFGGLTCRMLGYTGGTLACAADCLTYDTIACTQACTPDCGARICGPDPVCGTSCGTCTSGSCNTQGECVTCTPDCTGRECGPDPVCEVSCGSCAGTCNTTGECLTGTFTVASLATSAVTLTEGDTVTFTAIVTSPLGPSDVAGGVLRDTSGTITYGPFIKGSGGGDYSITLGWDQVSAAAPLNFGLTPETRNFVADFVDVAGTHATQSASLTFTCPVDHAACDGHCINTKADANNCGSCARHCNESAGCVDGECFAWTGCNSAVNESVTCSEVCAAQGGRCADACGAPAQGSAIFGSGGACLSYGDLITTASCDMNLNYYVSPIEAARCCCAEEPVGCLQDGSARVLREPAAGDLVITEIMPDPSGADVNREWFEIYVAADHSLDLNRLRFEVTNATPTTYTWTLDSRDCLVVSPGQYIIVAGQGAAVDGVSATASVAGAALFNSASTLTLLLGDTSIDTAPYANPSSGVSRSLSPTVLTTTGNDDINAWCPAPSIHPPYADRGSPGAANDLCP